MTDDELIDHISNCAGITKAQARRALECMQKGIIKGLKDTGKLDLAIGSFDIVKRRAALGRNPRTGESVSQPARNYIRFKASNALKKEISEIDIPLRNTF